MLRYEALSLPLPERTVRSGSPALVTARWLGPLLVASVLLAACARTPTPHEPAMRDGDPVDQIVAQVMNVPSKYCIPKEPHSDWGCAVFQGDTLLYFYRDSTGHIIAAGREWTAAVGVKTMPALADSFQARFTHVYGESQNCLPPQGDGSGFFFMVRHWHTPRFTLQLIVSPGRDDEHTYVSVEAVRSAFSCRSADVLRFSPRGFGSG